jgi:selenocysteine lyase/cysteine desulfurase
MRADCVGLRVRYALQVSVSGAGSSRLDFTARGLQEVLRASAAYYNSEQELERLVQALQELVESAAAE